MPPSGSPAQPLSASCSDLRLQGDEQGASALLLLQLDFPAAALARKFLDQARLCVRRLAVTLLGLCVDGTDGERHPPAVRLHVDRGGAPSPRPHQPPSPP